jgi:hypothetical protein
MIRRRPFVHFCQRCGEDFIAMRAGPAKYCATCRPIVNKERASRNYHENKKPSIPEPVQQELPIVDGWNVLDDNLLACSDNHIRAVFSMLRRQTNPIEFTGGLEAAKLKPWHVELLRSVKPKQMFFAYDTPDDYEPLVEAGKILLQGGFTTTSHAQRCYVLIGYPKDTTEKAEARLHQTIAAGFTPTAMLWRDRDGNTNEDWRRFQRQWARPAIIYKKLEAQ